MSGGTETGGDPDSPKNVEKINKRHSGIMKAADKLQKEGAEKSYYIDKEAEKRGMEREARKAQNKAAAKERAAQKRRSERNQLRRQGQYGAQGKYYVTKHMEKEDVNPFVQSSLEALGSIVKKNSNLDEEGYDHLRDRGMVKPAKDKKDATSYPPSDEVKKTQKVNKGPSALDMVKKKYGKAVMDMDKK